MTNQVKCVFSMWGGHQRMDVIINLLKIVTSLWWPSLICRRTYVTRIWQLVAQKVLQINQILTIGYLNDLFCGHFSTGYWRQLDTEVSPWTLDEPVPKRYLEVLIVTNKQVAVSSASGQWLRRQKQTGDSCSHHPQSDCLPPTRSLVWTFARHQHEIQQHVCCVQSHPPGRTVTKMHRTLTALTQFQ